MIKNSYDNLPYDLKLRINLGIILLLFILIFRLSPDFKPIDSQNQTFQSNERITIDLIDITTQSAPLASPPKPRVPVDVTQDPIISETELDPLFELEFVFESLELPEFGVGSGNKPGVGIGRIVRDPQRPPRVQRIVEPVSPDQSIRAEITALLTINPSGRVVEVEFQNIRIYNELTQRFETATAIDPAFLEATEYAALQWIFRPATHQGNNV
ncbi:MAG TPA: hypothetical protein DCE78_01230 [Bacteroidetes bacterium]|nr:hypothetical protein [Bacteroidota bacterium]